DILTKLTLFNESTTNLQIKIAKSSEEMVKTNKELLRTLQETNNIPGEASSNPEVESLKESLKIIDAETEEIIQKMDALK
ncbi:MAG: hypothetical protein QMB85_07630, partial [Sulfurospirillum sp.]